MTKPATQLEQERARLDDALDRLDAAVKGVTAKTQQQMAALRDERDRLNADLAAVRSEREVTQSRLSAIEATNASLERTVAEVTQRIDATIEQLKSALEG